MQVRGAASLVILCSALVTATAAVSFPTASSRKVVRVVWGMFTVLAASFSLASALRFYDMKRKDDDDDNSLAPRLDEEMSVRTFVGKTWNRYGSACTFIISGFSILAILEASWSAFKGKREVLQQSPQGAKRLLGLF